MDNSIQWAKKIVDNLPFVNKELDFDHLENILILALTKAYESGVEDTQDDYLKRE